MQDVSVVGVQLPNARTSDDKVPRGWVVLTDHGKRLSESEAKGRIDSWVKEELSKYKWLKGGIKFVDTVRSRCHTSSDFRRVFTFSCFLFGFCRFLGMLLVSCFHYFLFLIQ